MPARVVVVHDDATFLDDTVSALQGAGYDVAGFSQSMAAIEALQAAAQRVEILITRIRFPEGMPHGVSLALMARRKRPGIKVLFTVQRDMVPHAQEIGEVLIAPIAADEVVAKVREMLESDSADCPKG
jgi:DNA-binding NtrC family response regulator